MPTDKKIVVFGASANEAKYGHKIFATLLEHGFAVYGINPKGGNACGQVLFQKLADLPVTPEVAVMVIPPAGLADAVEQCIAAGVTEIWFQPGARDEAAFKKAADAGIKAVNGCFMVENGLW